MACCQTWGSNPSTHSTLELPKTPCAFRATNAGRRFSRVTDRNSNSRRLTKQGDSSVSENTIPVPLRAHAGAAESDDCSVARIAPIRRRPRTPCAARPSPPTPRGGMRRQDARDSQDAQRRSSGFPRISKRPIHIDVHGRRYWEASDPGTAPGCNGMVMDFRAENIVPDKDDKITVVITAAGENEAILQELDIN
jgi:hypothetical protein